MNPVRLIFNIDLPRQMVESLMAAYKGYEQLFHIEHRAELTAHDLPSNTVYFTTKQANKHIATSIYQLYEEGYRIYLLSYSKEKRPNLDYTLTMLANWLMISKQIEDSTPAIYRVILGRTSPKKEV